MSAKKNFASRAVPYRWRVMFHGLEQPVWRSVIDPKTGEIKKVADGKEAFLGGAKLLALKLEDVEEYAAQFCKDNPHWVVTRHTIERLGVSKGFSVKEGFE